LNHFGSVKKVKEADKGEIQAEIGEKVGEAVYEYFKSNG
jgi:excinuclease UvrABC nuclease subunit